MTNTENPFKEVVWERNIPDWAIVVQSDPKDAPIQQQQEEPKTEAPTPKTQETIPQEQPKPEVEEKKENIDIDALISEVYSDISNITKKKDEVVEDKKNKKELDTEVEKDIEEPEIRVENEELNKLKMDYSQLEKRYDETFSELIISREKAKEAKALSDYHEARNLDLRERMQALKFDSNHSEIPDELSPMVEYYRRSNSENEKESKLNRMRFADALRVQVEKLYGISLDTYIQEATAFWEEEPVKSLSSYWNPQTRSTTKQERKPDFTI